MKLSVIIGLNLILGWPTLWYKMIESLKCISILKYKLICPNTNINLIGLWELNICYSSDEKYVTKVMSYSSYSHCLKAGGDKIKNQSYPINQFKLIFLSLIKGSLLHSSKKKLGCQVYRCKRRVFNGEPSIQHCNTRSLIYHYDYFRKIRKNTNRSHMTKF